MSHFPRRKITKLINIFLSFKLLAIIFIVLLILDVILTRFFGESYDTKYAILAWIMWPLLAYSIIGLGISITLNVARSRRYGLFFYLLVLFIILFCVLLFVMNMFPSWKTLQNGLIMLGLSTFEALVLIFLLQLRKLRLHHFTGSLVGFIVGLRPLFTFKALKTYALITSISAALYFGYTLHNVNERLAKVENKLGGPKKITCNEKDTINKVRQSVVRIVGGESEGSGFAVKSGGMILTNFHVIEFEPAPKVVLPDNSFDTAEIIMADKNADLAIIKINKDLPVISWGRTDELQPAEELLAIGFPLGGQLTGEASVNKGSLSGRRKSKDVGVEYLQTDTTLTPGVSGGPMVNICGEVMGINTAGLSGLGLAISADSAKQKWLEMATSSDSLKDIKKITFDDTTSGEFAVATFYNYLKVRKLEKAFDLLSDNFKNGHGYEYWKQGYDSLLDTTVIKIEDDKKTKDRVAIKLSTKDMVNEEIVYKYFEGYWDVKNINGKWRLWDPEVKEVNNPGWMWFYE